MSDYKVVLITTQNKSEAQKITQALLVEKLAACVNILDKVESHFWWQDKVDQAQETLMIIKTQASKLQPLIDMVKKHHSYENPEIIALDITSGTPDYLSWIDQSLKND